MIWTRELFAKAAEAMSLDEDDYGSDRQIDAENAFFDHVGELGHDFDAYALKATAEERVTEALRLVMARNADMSPYFWT